MTFDELLDIRPRLTVAEYIQLWLLGYDDKIYIHLYKGDELVLKDCRIISPELIPYYEETVLYFAEDRELHI